MKAREFVDQLEDARIVAAIRAAESRTSGEIRVYISSGRPSDPRAAAVQRFQRLGMEKTAERNGVLIYLVPATRQFAILGDEAIHRHLADGLWEQIVAEMSTALRAGDATTAVEQAIARLSHELAIHFPRSCDDTNELPDEIIRES